MNAYKFCDFFDFSLTKESGYLTESDIENDYIYAVGDHYNYYAVDTQGTFYTRYIENIADLAGAFDSCFDDYINAEIEHDIALFGDENPNAFNYDAAKDGSYYEQAAEWIKTSDDYRGTIFEDVIRVLAGIDTLTA